MKVRLLRLNVDLEQTMSCEVCVQAWKAQKCCIGSTEQYILVAAKTTMRLTDKLQCKSLRNDLDVVTVNMSFMKGEWTVDNFIFISSITPLPKVNVFRVLSNRADSKIIHWAPVLFQNTLLLPSFHQFFLVFVVVVVRFIHSSLIKTKSFHDSTTRLRLYE